MPTIGVRSEVDRLEIAVLEGGSVRARASLPASAIGCRALAVYLADLDPPARVAISGVRAAERALQLAGAPTREVRIVAGDPANADAATIARRADRAI